MPIGKIKFYVSTLERELEAASTPELRLLLGAIFSGEEADQVQSQLTDDVIIPLGRAIEILKRFSMGVNRQLPTHDQQEFEIDIHDPDTSKTLNEICAVQESLREIQKKVNGWHQQILLFQNTPKGIDRSVYVKGNFSLERLNNLDIDGMDIQLATEISEFNERNAKRRR